MGLAPHRLSLLSQKLDRVAFVAYFLGAIVPLAALAWVAQRYALPVLPKGPSEYGFVGLLLSIGALSLGSFFLLRRVTRQSIARLDAHNRRLEVLIEASRAVADAPYAAEVCRAAAQFALALTPARAAFVLAKRGKEPDAPCVEGSVGDEALHAGFEGSFGELLDLVAAGGRVSLSHEDPGWPDGAPRPGALAVAPIVEHGAVTGLVAALHSAPGFRFDEAQTGSLQTLATLVSVARHVADLRDSQRNFFAHVTELLVTALDAFMDVQQGHARRVAHFAGLVGRELGLDEATLERLHFAGLLHDIGMLKIHPVGTLAKSVYRQHPLLGYRMLKPIRLWEELAPIVLHHHEWFDGRGYPEGLSGETIPLESRVIAVAEAFDSMTNPKSYREPLPVEEALRELREGAGTQFDPTVARIFVQLTERGLIEVGGA
jgi:putative nucleotidyltransferase with HDIG domain